MALFEGSAGDEGIGRRIARMRRLRGLTQQGLADRAYVSRSLIQQVETGRRAATPSLVAAVATALRVDPAELYGQPYRGDTAATDRVHACIADIRYALACVDVPPDLETPPRPLDTLASEVSTLKRLDHACRHNQVGARVPAVTTELTAHAHETDDPRAWWLLNRAIDVAVSLARRLGYYDLAGVGLDRAADAARRSDDANLSLLVNRSRSLILMTLGAWVPGLKLVRQAAEQADTDTPESQAVHGALRLRAAILAARAGNSSDAWDHHGAATDIAQRLPANTPDYYGLQFNRANASIHGAAVAVELEDHDEAIRRDAKLVSPAGLPAERRAHHDIDVARALVATGQSNQALSRLVRADRTAPQMTRYHPMARESVGRLVDHHRALPEQLRMLHDRMRLA